MDQTALVRVKARRAACQAAGSENLASCHRCSLGRKAAQIRSSRSDRRPCVPEHRRVARCCCIDACPWPLK